MDLPVTLRDLARRVDVRVPILPPPGLASALLAAATEIERQEARIVRQKQDVDLLTAHAAEHAANVADVHGVVKTAAARMAAMQRDAQALLAGAEVAGPALRELLPLLAPLMNAAVAARKALGDRL